MSEVPLYTLNVQNVVRRRAYQCQLPSAVPHAGLRRTDKVPLTTLRGTFLKLIVGLFF